MVQKNCSTNNFGFPCGGGGQGSCYWVKYNKWILLIIKYQRHEE